MANQLALIKRDTVDVVAAKVREFQEKGELHFPPNYSPENAMKSAWLTLQETVDRNKKPALEVCTKDSIANALLDMVIQGLSPAKKQCYFIVYGNKLQLQRSYFGTESAVKRILKDCEIFSQVVYKGDVFEYEIRGANKFITKHGQKLENVNGKNILAAYCVIMYDSGNKQYTEIMTFDEIKQAWKQSKVAPIDASGNVKADSTHGKFTQEMAKKTVINRACKNFINTSDDSDLVISTFNRTTENEYIEEEDVQAEIEENANSEVIDVTSEPEPEPETDTAYEAPSPTDTATKSGDPF